MEMMEILRKNNATKTIKLRDLLKLDNSVLDILVMRTPEQSEKLKSMFKAIFNEYEIGGETPTMFKNFVTDVHAEYIDYYQELIDTYEEKINYLDGYKSTTEIYDNNTRNENYNHTKVGNYNDTENYNDTKSSEGESTSENKDKDYSLPHKQVDSVTGYLSGQHDHDGTNQINSSTTVSSSNVKAHTDREEELRNNTITANNSQTITKVGGANVVDQKFNYIKKLRNVYKEFVEQFSVCFLQIY